MAPDARTDAELLGLIAGGDRPAFEELYRRYARSVLGIALRRMGDRGRAEDVTQDTFASIWRSASRYDPARGRPASWLYTVARNAIVDGLRRRPDPTVADPPDVAAGDPGPPEAAEASGSRGASTGHSRRCPSTSARSSSWRTGAGCRRVRSRSTSGCRSVPSRRERGRRSVASRASWRKSWDD